MITLTALFFIVRGLMTCIYTCCNAQMKETCRVDSDGDGDADDDNNGHGIDLPRY